MHIVRRVRAKMPSLPTRDLSRFALLCAVGAACFTSAGCGGARRSVAGEKLAALDLAIEVRFPIQHIYHLYYPVCRLATTGAVNEHDAGSLYACTLYPGTTLATHERRLETHWWVAKASSSVGTDRPEPSRAYEADWKRVTGLSYVARYAEGPHLTPAPLPIAHVAAVTAKG